MKVQKKLLIMSRFIIQRPCCRILVHMRPSWIERCVVLITHDCWIKARGYLRLLREFCLLRRGEEIDASLTSNKRIHKETPTNHWLMAYKPSPRAAVRSPVGETASTLSFNPSAPPTFLPSPLYLNLAVSSLNCKLRVLHCLATLIFLHLENNSLAALLASSSQPPVSRCASQPRTA